ncbi:zinc finger protein 845-like [Saccostrea echinata]|uniref:zinc finger protein 845-like n=1 Tax=Saccostrea echinata TaxID=191078 RepID=UPI002A817C0C|nr:zinc finger protein 845-like [Saccostrea echinata]
MVDAETQTYTSLSEDAHYMVQKAVEKGNDIFYVSNNLNTKETTYFGTDLGKKFLDSKRELLLEFYKFCVETYSSETGVVAVITTEGSEEPTTSKIQDESQEEEIFDDDQDEDWKAEKKTSGTPSRIKHIHRRTPKVEQEEKTGVKCEKCFQIFKTDEYLKQHMQIHQRINYHCPDCDRPFSVKRYIYNHMKTMHGKDYNASIQIKMTPYEPSDCPECKETFPSTEMLEIHMDREHHSDKQTKSKTPKIVPSRTSKRIRKVTEKMRNSQETLERKEEIEKDEEENAPGEVNDTDSQEYAFVCRVCQKGFNLRRSIGVHMRKSHNMAYHEEDNETEKEETKEETEPVLSTPARAKNLPDDAEEDVITTRSGRKSKKSSKLLESESPSKGSESPRKSISEKSSLKGTPKAITKDTKTASEQDDGKENQSDQMDDGEKGIEEDAADKENIGEEEMEEDAIEKMKEEEEEIHDSDEEYNPTMEDEEEFKPKPTRSSTRGMRSTRGLKRKPVFDEGVEVNGVILTTPGRKKRKDSNINIPQQRITNQNLLEGRCEETIVDNKVWYKCLLCSKTMRMRTAIIKHLKTHDEMLEGAYQCYICDVRFSTNFKLGNHLRDIHKKLNAFECEKCKLKFSGRKAFIEHEAICNVDPESVAPQPPSEEEMKIQTTCIFCKEQFQSREELQDHENSHVSENGAFLCPHCDYSFLEKSFCKLHILTIHSPEENLVEEKDVNPLQCRLCLKILNTQETYDAHMKIHDDESLVCKICNKRFNYPYTLRNHHMLHHSEEYAFKCPHCPQQFKLKRYMTKHINDKHEEASKPKEKSDMETCKICDTPYVSKVELLEHMKESHEHIINTHRKATDDPEKFGCARCHKVYNTVDDFIIHVSNHRPKKKLVCDFCGNTFNTKSNLNTHVRLKHSTVRPFECNICNKKYALRTLLNQHVRFQHCNERPVSCNICGKGFRTKSQLQKHSYSHRENTIDCEACEHKSWTMEGYKIHLVATHPELAMEKKIHHYTCQYCNRKFAVLHQYKRHLAIHTGQKPHKCNHCDYACSSLGTLNSHIKRVHNPSSRIFQCNFCFMTFAEAGKMYRHMDTTKHIENCRRNGVDPHTIREDVSYLIKSKENTTSRRGYNMGQSMKKMRPTEIIIENVDPMEPEVQVEAVVEDPGEYSQEELKIEVPMATSEEEVTEVIQEVQEVQEEEVQEGEQQIEINSEVLQQILEGAALGAGQDQLPQNIEIKTQLDEDGMQCFVIQLPENSEFTVV